MTECTTDRRGRSRRRRALPIGAPLVAAGAVVIAGAAAPRGGEEIQFDDARMIIEYNSTDDDIGVQVFLDGDPWRIVEAFAPDGHRILRIRGFRSMAEQGLTELFFESSEPPLDEVSLEEFLARFPEGVYEFEGRTIDGDDIEAEAVFTHAIPEGPILLSPLEGSVQDPRSTIVEWLPVPDPPGSMIMAYEVIVSQLIDVLPKRSFDVLVPAGVTSMTVPPEYLQYGAEYEFEVLAIETSGNQTLSSSFFTTMR